MAILDLIADERRKTADVLDGLTEAQLSTPSLCTEWTAHDIGAHLLAPLVTPVRRLLVLLLTSAGNVNKVNVKMTALTAKKPTSEIAAELRSKASHPFKPPSLGHEAPLTDLVVHGQDLRRPLGIDYRPTDETLRTALDFLTTPKASRGFVPKGRMAGLRFEATDLEWSHGEGEVVRGPATSLALAFTGRPSACDDLEGAGVATLRERVR